MDFDITSLLNKPSGSKDAKTNGKTTKKASPGQVRGQTTTLSESIKNFKAKQEADKKQKLKEESEKKANLLELRAGNKQSSRAANAMLKMAKSANKSVIDEATNHRDTSATLAGRNQCDNDDYGYESKASQSVYEKLMAKYESNHEDPMAKFAKPKRPKPLGERDPKERRSGERSEKKERKPDPNFNHFANQKIPSLKQTLLVKSHRPHQILRNLDHLVQGHREVLKLSKRSIINCLLLRPLPI